LFFDHNRKLARTAVVADQLRQTDNKHHQKAFEEEEEEEECVAVV